MHREDVRNESMKQKLVMAAGVAVLGLAGTCGSLAAEPAPTTREDTAITIYSSAEPGGIPPELYRPLPGGGVPNGMAVPGYATVRHDRVLHIAPGRSTVAFTDVAALIDPTTVTFASLSDPQTRVLEQNFQFDLVSTDKLLLKFLDRPVTAERQSGSQSTSTSGTLLSAAGGLVLRGADGSISALRDWSALRFPELPAGLRTRPTLVWDLSSPRGGEQRTRVAYQTGGITWWADYNLVFSPGTDANRGTLDLSAWVSVVNQSGASYEDARLKLIAGDVQRITPEPRGALTRRMMAVTAEDSAAGFEQKSFFEFHLYTLGRRTTLPDNSTKQIELFEQARRVPVRRTLVYSGLASAPLFGVPYTEREPGVEMNRKVDVFLSFRNEKQAGLGVPLPAGRIRVSQLDGADGSLELIGEDRIAHTPKDEEVRVRLGSAFDVVGERRQVDFAVDTRAHWLEEEIEVKLRNHKSEPVDVLVQERLYRWSNWQVVSKTHEFRKEDARTIQFPVRVAKDAETVLRYRVRYTW